MYTRYPFIMFWTSLEPISGEALKADLTVHTCASPSFSGLELLAARKKTSSERGCSWFSSVGCMKILAVTVVPAGKGFPTSHCSVRLLDGVGGEQRTET